MNKLVIAIIALVLFGVLGKTTTASYHCHYEHIGDTIACV